MSRLINPIIRKPTQGATSPLKKRLSRAPRGQGMVEFALVLPLLLLLIFGIIELGRLMVIYTSVATASRDAARYASAAGNSDNFTCIADPGPPIRYRYCAYYEDIEGIQDAAQRFGILLAIPSDQIDVNWDGGPGGWGPCADPNVLCQSIVLGDRVVVTVSAVYDPLLGLTPLPTFPITSTTSRTIVKDVPVEAALGVPGSNNRPIIVINDPDDGVRFEPTYQILFSGEATDTEDGVISANIEWRSNRDGDIGNGASFTRALSSGEHQITARIEDSDGNVSEARITIMVNAPPRVDILSPVDGYSVELGMEINFTGIAQDDLDDLTNTLDWYDGPCDTGSLIAGNTDSFSYSALLVGLHIITACTTDSSGLPGFDSITVVITVNMPPTVTILSPLNNATMPPGSIIRFTGRAIDAKDGDLSMSLRWTSNGNVLIGNGADFSTSDLVPGSHIITAEVTDSNGLTGSAVININIDARDPVVRITSPSNGDSFVQGPSINLTGEAMGFIADNVWDELSDELVWYLNGNRQIGTGPNASLSTLDLVPGAYTITAEVTDFYDRTGTASITIYIVEQNDPPVVTIIEPDDGFVVPRGVDITFEGTVTDPQQPTLSSQLSWASSIDNFLGTGPSLTRALSVGLHTITASVTDAGGLYAEASIQVRVYEPVCPSPGSATFTYPGNRPDRLVWTLTIPSGTTQVNPFILYHMRLLLDNTLAELDSITVEGQPVDANQIDDTDPSAVEVNGDPLTDPIWSGSFQANNTIQIIYDFTPNPQAFADGPFTLVATFWGCSSIQTIARP